jgi:hypothetical protein
MKILQAILMLLIIGCVSASQGTIYLNDKQACEIQTILNRHYIREDNMKKGVDGHQPARIKRARAVMRKIMNFFPEQTLDTTIFAYNGSSKRLCAMSKTLTIVSEKQSKEALLVKISYGSKVASSVLYHGVIRLSTLQKKQVTFAHN